MLYCKSNIYQVQSFYSTVQRGEADNCMHARKNRGLGGKHHSYFSSFTARYCNTATAFLISEPISRPASCPQACQLQYTANWVNAAMLIFLKAVGRLRRRRRLDESEPLPPCCSTLFTKRHSSAFVKDGFINRGGTTIARRDWVCWLIPSCLLPHAGIHQPDATSLINYLQTCLLAPDKFLSQI